MNSTLNTAEIKNDAGVATVWNRVSSSERESIFQNAAEAPNAPQRLTIKHSEIGTGINRRRRSVVRFDYSRSSTVDTTKIITCSAYTVFDSPVGAITANANVSVTLAYLNSFMASLGATAIILYDGTGNGSRCLLTGEV